GGGSSLSGWHQVGSIGEDLGALSAGTGQALFQAINWTAILSPLVPGGVSLALVGNEGSTSVSRTFSFYDQAGGLVNSVVVGPTDSRNMVRTFTEGGDTYTRFTFNGTSVVAQQQTLGGTITRIRVTGSAGSGGGGPLSGWYEVTSTGSSLASVSGGT